MPFTPFHMGAGLIAKAATNKKFSLVSFGLAQILWILSLVSEYGWGMKSCTGGATPCGGLCASVC